MTERAITRFYGEVLLEDEVVPPPPVTPPARTTTTTGKYKAMSPGPDTPPGQRPVPRHQYGLANASRDQEIRALQERISQLEALVSRDEDVLRKVLGLLVDKGIATREEILERLG
jgi:hypothetical protein